ncbi:hypothetical protein LUZ60_011428 [Juncus effusus]|nr:hypothetical protein LUZ60_011428 [Juncus effusus]
MNDPNTMKMKQTLKSRHDRPDPAPSSSMQELELLLGYTFLNPHLLQESLTHPSSASSSGSYERLEFLGDAALSLAMSFLLSTIRSVNVSTEKLARAAVRHMLYTFVRRNSSKLDRQVEQFTIAVMDEPEESQIHGGSTMKAPKVLADIVESIAGAVFVDSNFSHEIMWKVMKGILEPIITADTIDEQPITSLYELCSKKGKTLDFQYWQKGKLTVVNVFLDEKLIGNSASEQKTVARLNAARDALQNLYGEMSHVVNKPPIEIGGEKEAKQELIKLCTKNHWSRPVYRLENVEGPSHGKRFVSSVQVETPNGVLMSLGEYKSKVKDAENSAASKMASEILKEI